MRHLTIRTVWGKALAAAGLLTLASLSFAQTALGGSPQGQNLPPGTVTASDHLLVAFKPGTPDSLRNDLIKKYGLLVNVDHGNRYFMRLDLSSHHMAVGIQPSDFVRSLQTNPAVQYAELDVQITPDFVPNDPQFAQQWHHNNTGQTGGTPDADVDAVEGWDNMAGVQEVVVAVCDDGVDIDHEDLRNRVWVNPNETPGNGIDDDNNGFIDDIFGWDTADNDNNPRPNNGDSHGTHVAGIVAAEQNNGKGVSGVAPNVKLMCMRHYKGQASWISDLASAIDYAWQNGAQVITVSYNIDGWNQTLLQAIQRAGAADVVYCNSAGNNGQQNPPRQQIRALADNVIFVASTDHNDTKSGFSNWGTLIEVGSPGSNILSTFPNNTYATISGTSMATPLAAGIVGVIRGAFPALTAREALDTLISTCDQVPALTNFIANGARVNLANALTGPPAPTGLLDFTLVMGTLQGGGLPELLDSDDAKVVIDTESVPGRGQYAAFQVTVSSPKASTDVASMKVTVESMASDTSAVQYVTAYNNRTGAWDLLSSTKLGTTDNDITFDVAKRSLRDYVDADQHVKLRFMAYAPLKRRGAFPVAFSYSTDNVAVVIK